MNEQRENTERLERKLAHVRSRVVRLIMANKEQAEEITRMKTELEDAYENSIIECPDCEGIGEIAAGDDPLHMLDCPRCDGEGRIVWPDDWEE